MNRDQPTTTTSYKDKLTRQFSLPSDLMFLVPGGNLRQVRATPVSLQYRMNFRPAPADRIQEDAGTAQSDIGARLQLG